MAIEILLPRLGWTMEEGVFVEWLKRDGDLVQPGDLLFTIESDKATNEVETFESGILRLAPDGPLPGSTLPVGAVLGYLVQPGERAPFEAEAENPDQRTKNQEQITTDDGRRTTDDGRRTTNGIPTPNPRRHGPAISPRARRVAAELGIGWAALAGSGRSGRIVERDIRALAAQAPTGQVHATPLARRMAEELGVDLNQLAAGQPGRRIERSEVEQAARAQPTAAVPAAPAAAPAQTQPIGGIRRITATRMAESAHTTASVTLTTEADATDMHAPGRAGRSDRATALLRRPGRLAPWSRPGSAGRNATRVPPSHTAGSDGSVDRLRRASGRGSRPGVRVRAARSTCTVRDRSHRTMLRW